MLEPSNSEQDVFPNITFVYQKSEWSPFVLSSVHLVVVVD
jgi:hypothetical protein